MSAKEYKSTQDTHNQGSGTPNVAQSGRNTKDRKYKHPYLWRYSPIQALAYLHETLRFTSVLLDLRHSVGLLGRMISS
jgi:hypothetical protein